MSELEQTVEWVERDGGMYEVITTVTGEAECVVCGRDVPLVAETMGWTKGDDGRWYHEDDGGLSTGQCCDKLYTDWWEGTFVYDLAAGGSTEDTK